MRLLSNVQNVKINSKISYLEKHYIHITSPKEIAKKMSQLVGMENEREEFTDALRYIRNLKHYREDPVHAPHSRFLLAGAPGSGKTLLVSSLAKEARIPLITVDMSSFVSFPRRAKKLVDTIFDVAGSFTKGCVIHIQNYSAINALKAESLMLFHNQLTQKIANASNAIVVLSTIEQQIALPNAYFSPNVFSKNKVIQIMPPTLKTRSALFEEYFEKYKPALSSDVSAERLARNTLGMYPKDIEFIVRETMLYAARKEQDVVTAKDFNEVMLALEAGHTYNQMSEKERLSTAYHEAGHVIAAYYSNPDYILGRVEITPRAASLGLTQEEAGEEKFSMFKSDCKKEIIYSLGGKAAEDLIYGENTTGVSADISSASSLALLMVQNFGMDKDIGPICIDDDLGFCSEKIFDLTESVAREYLKKVEEETFEIVKTHRKSLEALAKALMEHEVLMGDEIKQILISAEG